MNNNRSSSHSPRIDKGMEMELKILDLLGKRIQENNSIEDKLGRKDLDIVSSMRAFLTKQHEDFMKHLQELVTDKEESLGELLPSRLELVMSIHSQPDVSNMTNFFSTSFRKIVQAHKSTLAEATTKTECDLLRISSQQLLAADSVACHTKLLPS